MRLSEAVVSFTVLAAIAIAFLNVAVQQAQAGNFPVAVMLGVIGVIILGLAAWLQAKGAIEEVERRLKR
jgi:uncharacterized YccA/Bax inhibitor family protein